MRNLFRKKYDKNKEPVAGSVRQSQLINTFGIGSIIDFVKDTVIVAGVDDWDIQGEDQRIYNENLQALTGANFFIAPKVDEGSSFWNKSRDIPSFVFPEKLYCPKCKSILDAEELQNFRDPHTCFLNNSEKKQCKGQLVASRFVVLCENGHIEDFPYSWWVHSGKTCPSGSGNPRVKMYNVENRSDIYSLTLECVDCGARRTMAGAFSEHAFSGEVGYPCSGHHPHLKSYSLQGEGPCEKFLKTRLRSSSGIYFPVTQSVLSIPPWSRRAMQVVLKSYGSIKYMRDDIAVKNYIEELLLPYVQPQITSDDLFGAYKVIQEHKTAPTSHGEPDIYLDEYTVLCRGTMEGDDEYSAFEVQCPEPFKDYFEKLVAVDKLTVIQSLCGFTRDKQWGGEDLSDERIVPLSAVKKEWLPAVKMKGEGIFIQFNTCRIQEWASRVSSRYETLGLSLKKSYLRNSRFSPEYVLLHTFAHMLIRQLSNECGYSTASLKEKIYSTFKGGINGRNMSGVLIYLTSSDCDGSLGGLVSIAQEAEQMRRLLTQMLLKALWCSGDPLCSESKTQGFNSLNYAACHDCVLLPETSCEFRNVLLDRVAIVGQPENRSLGLMGEMTESLIVA